MSIVEATSAIALGVIGISAADLNVHQEVLIEQSSTALSQFPDNINEQKRIEFGAAVGTPSDPISMDSTGLFTCNSIGSYFPKIRVQFGKSGGGGESDTFIALLVDGIQQGDSIWSRLDDSKTVIPLSASSIVLELTVGQTFEFVIWNDNFDLGVNDGGLLRGDPNTIGTNVAPSASIGVSMLVIEDV